MTITYLCAAVAFTGRASAAPAAPGRTSGRGGGGRFAVFLEYPFGILFGAQLGAQAGVIIVLAEVASRLGLHHELDRRVLAEAEAFENEGSDFVQVFFVGHDVGGGVTSLAL